MATKFYHVTADHIMPQYGCKDLLAVCSTSHGPSPLWYASMAGFGCSKDYPTPEGAIRNMLADHACTNIRIVEIG